MGGYQGQRQKAEQEHNGCTFELECHRTPQSTEVTRQENCWRPKRPSEVAGGRLGRTDKDLDLIGRGLQAG